MSPVVQYYADIERPVSHSFVGACSLIRDVLSVGGFGRALSSSGRLLERTQLLYQPNNHSSLAATLTT